MKRLFLLLIAFLLVFSLGCADISDIGEWGGENGDETVAEDPPVPGLSPILTEDITLGFISDSAEDDCYTKLCEAALREIAVSIGADEQNFKAMYNVTPGYECTRVAEILISLGCNVIVSVGDSLTDGLQKAAKSNPEVYFIASGTNEHLDNMSVYSVDTARVQYLFGAVAATLSDTQRIGYIASLDTERVADVNAFALGALAVSPELTVDVAFSDELDREYADLVLKQFSVGGCDIFVRHGDGDILREYAADTSVSVLDICVCEGEDLPIKVNYNFGNVFLPFFEMISNGEWIAAASRLSFSDGGIEFDISNGGFTDDELQILSAVIDDIASEDFEVFCGEIRNNDGEIEIKEGESLPQSEVDKMDFLVFGIAGNLPEQS